MTKKQVVGAGIILLLIILLSRRQEHVTTSFTPGDVLDYGDLWEWGVL